MSTKKTGTSSLSTVSGAMWALVAIIAVMALIIGFLIADRGNNGSHAAPAAEQPAATSSAAPRTTLPNAPTGVAALSQEEIQELAATVEPGEIFINDADIDPFTLGPAETITSADDVLLVHRRQASDPFGIGALDAPVTIAEFSEYECPFCARHATVTEPSIMEKYVDTGLVRIEWNDFAVNGSNSIEAAKAARAAAEQGKFHEFKQALFESHTDIQSRPNNTMEDFERFAEEAGVEDMDRFRATASDDTYTSTVNEATRYASTIGMTGTPGFIIGETFVSGAQPLDVFEEVILLELAKVADGEVEVPAVNV